MSTIYLEHAIYQKNADSYLKQLDNCAPIGIHYDSINAATVCIVWGQRLISTGTMIPRAPIVASYLNLFLIHFGISNEQS